MANLRWLGLWGLLFLGVLGSCRADLSPREQSELEHAQSVVAGLRLKGKVAKMGSRQRLTDFRYDLLGRPILIRHELEGASYTYGADYAYIGGSKVAGELGNRLKQTRYPDDERVEMHFDAAGQLQQLTSTLPGVYSDVISSHMKLNTLGQVEWVDSGNHTRTHHVFNSIRRPMFVITEKLNNHEVLQAFGYAYDKVGRVTEVRDFCAQTDAGVTCCDPREASCEKGPLSAKYEYDAAGSLKTMTTDSGVQHFAANAMGNLVQKNGALQEYQSTQHPHAVTKVMKNHVESTYAYNLVGALSSMTEDGVTTQFSWNARNMPVRTEREKNSTERAYLGEELYKRVDSIQGKTSTTLFLPGLRLEDGVLRKFYGKVAERETATSGTRGTLRFYHVDHLGSSTLVTDEAGNPVSRRAYFPFGEERQGVGDFTSKRQFTAKEKEPVSGLYDFGARLYNPRTGQFISADSVVDGLNAYSYVFNNPINFVDPDGHQTQTPRDVRNQIVIREFMDVIAKAEKKTFWDLIKAAGRKTRQAVRNFLTPMNDNSVSMGIIKSAIHDGFSSRPIGTSAPLYIDPRIFENKTEVAKGWAKGAVNVATGTVNWFYPEWEQAYGTSFLPTLESSNVYQSYGQSDAMVASAVAPAAVAGAVSKMKSLPVVSRTAHSLETATLGILDSPHWVTQDNTYFELLLDSYRISGATKRPAVQGSKLRVALDFIYRREGAPGYGLERFIEASQRSASQQGLRDVEIEIRNVINDYLELRLDANPRFTRVTGSHTADFVGTYRVDEVVTPILKQR